MAGERGVGMWDQRHSSPLRNIFFDVWQRSAMYGTKVSWQSQNPDFVSKRFDRHIDLWHVPVDCEVLIVVPSGPERRRHPLLNAENSSSSSIYRSFAELS